jgi:hypothetical protein
MSCSILSVATSLDDFAVAEPLLWPAPVLAVAGEFWLKPATESINAMKSAATGEKRLLTNPKSPLDYWSNPLKYREMITPIGVNCDGNSCLINLH